jgi:hypothetical protein
MSLRRFLRNCCSVDEFLYRIPVVPLMKFRQTLQSLTQRHRRDRREKEGKKDGRPNRCGFVRNSFFIEFVKKAVVNLRD